MYSLGLAELRSISLIPAGVPGWLERPVYYGWRLSGFREHDLRLYLEMMEDALRVTTNVFPEALKQAAIARKEMRGRVSSGLGKFAMLARRMRPRLERGVEKEALLVARLRCALAAVGVERYRLEHGGGLPATLSELVPAYLRAVPLDPASGEPLSYETLADGGGCKIVAPAASVLRGAPGSIAFSVVREKARRPGRRGLGD